MANSAAICTSFKTELMLGAHQLGTVTLISRTSLTAPTTDTINGALYFATASLSASTTVYTVTGEATGTGYAAGGIAVTNANPPTNTTTIGWWNPSASLVWAGLTIGTAFDTVLFYNFTQTVGGVGRAICVNTFGSQTITSGTLTLSMPASDSTHALIQLA